MIEIFRGEALGEGGAQRSGRLLDVCDVGEEMARNDVEGLHRFLCSDSRVPEIDGRRELARGHVSERRRCERERGQESESHFSF